LIPTKTSEFVIQSCGRGPSFLNKFSGDRLSVPLGCDELVQEQTVVYFVGPAVYGGAG